MKRRDLIRHLKHPAIYTPIPLSSLLISLPFNAGGDVGRQKEAAK
ncbi:MAG: hypothetical protein R3B96_07145 [Pirellulaceae bacterium]